MSLSIPRSPYPKSQYPTAEEVLTVLPNVNEYFVRGRAGRRVFERHSELSVAIANNDEERVDALLKKHYVSTYKSTTK